MAWTLVARKDFEDGVRSRMIWNAVGVFSALMLLVGFASVSDGSVSETRQMIVLFTNTGGQILVPLIALAIGYKAIVEERESGGLRVLFGLAHSRRDIFLGKLTSRLLIISIATVISCLVAVMMVIVTFEDFPVRTFLGFVGITVLFGAAFTGIAVGISAAVGTRVKALAGMIGTYVFFLMFWYPLIAGIHYVVEGDLAGYEASNWYFFLLRMNPIEAYIQTTSSLSDQFIWHAIGWQNVVEDIPDGTTGDDLLLVNRISGDLPYYLSAGSHCSLCYSGS